MQQLRRITAWLLKQHSLWDDENSRSLLGSQGNISNQLLWISQHKLAHFLWTTICWDPVLLYSLQLLYHYLTCTIIIREQPNLGSYYITRPNYHYLTLLYNKYYSYLTPKSDWLILWVGNLTITSCCQLVTMYTFSGGCRDLVIQQMAHETHQTNFWVATPTSSTLTHSWRT